MIIAFSGLDGSGKTTQIERLTCFLEKQGYSVFKVHFIHRSLSFKLGQLLERAKENIEPKTLELQKAKNLKNNRLLAFANAFARRMLLIADGLTFRIWIFATRNKYDFVICDRYFLDLIVTLAQQTKLGKSFYRFFNRLIPIPNCHFYLDSSPEVVIERKAEHSIDFLKTRQNLYNRFMTKEIYRISDVNIETSQFHIKEIIRKKCAR